MLSKQTFSLKALLIFTTLVCFVLWLSGRDNYYFNYLEKRALDKLWEEANPKGVNISTFSEGISFDVRDTSKKKQGAVAIDLSGVDWTHRVKNIHVSYLTTKSADRLPDLRLVGINKIQNFEKLTIRCDLPELESAWRVFSQFKGDLRIKSFELDFMPYWIESKQLFSPEAKEALASLKNLEHLKTTVCSNDIDVLRELKNLKSLTLTGGGINSNIFEHVEGLNNLEALEISILRNSDITQEMLDDFQEKMPDLKITAYFL
ncbi:MAG: hypothetical protein MPJ24_09880 [Pirellulaceae bacterium]|nr:hypothetical protein [Pirellulaceae bacterium]